MGSEKADSEESWVEEIEKKPEALHFTGIKLEDNPFGVNFPQASASTDNSPGSSIVHFYAIPGTEDGKNILGEPMIGEGKRRDDLHRNSVPRSFQPGGSSLRSLMAEVIYPYRHNASFTGGDRKMNNQFAQMSPGKPFHPGSKVLASVSAEKPYAHVKFAAPTNDQRVKMEWLGCSYSDSNNFAVSSTELLDSSPENAVSLDELHMELQTVRHSLPGASSYESEGVETYRARKILDDEIPELKVKLETTESEGSSNPALIESDPSVIFVSDSREEESSYPSGQDASFNKFTGSGTNISFTLSTEVPKSEYPWLKVEMGEPSTSGLNVRPPSALSSQVETITRSVKNLRLSRQLRSWWKVNQSGSTTVCQNIPRTQTVPKAVQPRAQASTSRQGETSRSRGRNRQDSRLEHLSDKISCLRMMAGQTSRMRLMAGQTSRMKPRGLRRHQTPHDPHDGLRLHHEDQPDQISKMWFMYQVLKRRRLEACSYEQAVSEEVVPRDSYLSYLRSQRIQEVTVGLNGQNRPPFPEEERKRMLRLFNESSP